jgi:hypothetical protein
VNFCPRFLYPLHRTIGDEAIYLRINQLQIGLLQFTDSPNAERLVKERGADIRHIAPWKKWVVWADTHWQVDNRAALFYTKQLQMVRNIYVELTKPPTTGNDGKSKSTPSRANP